MRNLFPGYYRPTENEFADLWANCIFVPDTNVLLSAYRTSPSAKETLIDIFNQISDQLWIPYHVAFEYQTRRLGEISKQVNAYQKVSDYLTKQSDMIKEGLNEYRKHAFLNVEDVNTKIDKFFGSVIKQIDKQRGVHPDWLSIDPIHEELTELFNGKVGAPYTEEQLQVVLKDAEERVKAKQPPGFRDEKKEDNKYGDIVIWHQILDYAKNQKKPIIFITDDKKDDWWFKHEGRTIGPRPELIEEIHKKCNVQFYMYSTLQFVSWAQTYLNREDKPEVLNELRELRQNDESTLLTEAKREEMLRRLVGVDLGLPSSLQAELDQRVAVRDRFQDSLAYIQEQARRNAETLEAVRAAAQRDYTERLGASDAVLDALQRATVTQRRLWEQEEISEALQRAVEQSRLWEQTRRNAEALEAAWAAARKDYSGVIWEQARFNAEASEALRVAAAQGDYTERLEVSDAVLDALQRGSTSRDLIDETHSERLARNAEPAKKKNLDKSQAKAESETDPDADARLAETKSADSR